MNRSVSYLQVLKTEEILHAIKHPCPLIYGIVAVLGVTPCLGFACIRLPLSPPEFAIGAPLREALHASGATCEAARSLCKRPRQCSCLSSLLD